MFSMALAGHPEDAIRLEPGIETADRAVIATVASFLIFMPVRGCLHITAIYLLAVALKEIFGLFHQSQEVDFTYRLVACFAETTAFVNQISELVALALAAI